MRRLLAALAAGALLAGCGGAATLSRSQLVARADAICRSALDSLTHVPQPGSQTDPRAIAAYLSRIIPIADRQLAQLSALHPPSGMAAAWRAFLNAQRAATQTFSDVRNRADARDLAGIQALGSTASARAAAANAAAQRLGATTCAGS